MAALSDYIMREPWWSRRSLARRLDEVIVLVAAAQIELRAASNCRRRNLRACRDERPMKKPGFALAASFASPYTRQ